MSRVLVTVPGVSRQPLRSVGQRLRQGFAALRSRPDPVRDARLRQLLANDAQWSLLARLTPYDRRHHLAVHGAVVAAGCQDADVHLAALLHDVGKADARRHVGLVHRTVSVFLQGRMSRMLQRVARENAGWLRHGLWLNLHHPALGAELAARAGANARVCELIRLHADRDAAARDAALATLLRADNEALL